MKNESLVEIFIECAKELKECYTNAEDVFALACLMDRCADFLDVFIAKGKDF